MDRARLEPGRPASQKKRLTIMLSPPPLHVDSCMQRATETKRRTCPVGQVSEAANIILRVNRCITGKVTSPLITFSMVKVAHP